MAEELKTKYIHLVCGDETIITKSVAKDLNKLPPARDNTYCVSCADFFPLVVEGVVSFNWVDGEPIGG